MSDFVGEQSRVRIMPISAKWKHKSSIHIGFIVFNGGVTTLFAKNVYIYVCVYIYIYIYISSMGICLSSTSLFTGPDQLNDLVISYTHVLYTFF